MSNFYVSQGYYILKKNVYDTDSFYDNHKTVIDRVLDWAKENGHDLWFGISENSEYFVMFRFTSDDSHQITDWDYEFKNMLKGEFPSMELHGYSNPDMLFNVAWW